MLFPYGMCHFSQADFQILSLVSSSLTTMDLEMVLCVSRLLGIPVLLESKFISSKIFSLSVLFSPTFLSGIPIIIFSVYMVLQVTKFTLNYF